MTRLATLLVVLALATGCAAVQYTQTDLVPLARAERTRLRDTATVAIGVHPVPPMTFDGLSDERAAAIVRSTGIEAPLRRVRERVVARLGELGYASVARASEVTLPGDDAAALGAVPAPYLLDFRTTSWGLGNLRRGGEARARDPIYVHHFVRARLVRTADGEVLWRAVCGLRGYPGDAAVPFEDLTASGGGRLREQLATAADGCAAELVQFFLGGD